MLYVHGMADNAGARRESDLVEKQLNSIALRYVFIKGMRVM